QGRVLRGGAGDADPIRVLPAQPDLPCDHYQGDRRAVSELSADGHDEPAELPHVGRPRGTRGAVRSDHATAGSAGHVLRDLAGGAGRSVQCGHNLVGWHDDALPNHGPRFSPRGALRLLDPAGPLGRRSTGVSTYPFRIMKLALAEAGAVWGFRVDGRR